MKKITYAGILVASVMAAGSVVAEAGLDQAVSFWLTDLSRAMT